MIIEQDSLVKVFGVFHDVLMALMQTLSNLRGGEHSIEEKPFLQHLEDLRRTLVKGITTLALGVLVCFTCRNSLMEVMRRPIDRVWRLQLSQSLQDLPTAVSPETWKHATLAASHGGSLSPSQQKQYYQHLSNNTPHFRFHIEAVQLWKSALTITDPKQRILYIQSLPDLTPALRDQLIAIHSIHQKNKGIGPDPEADSYRRSVFMQSLNPTEGFMLSFKLALYAGIALTFPLLLYFILQYILPALHQNERRAIFPAITIGSGLFLIGALFSYSIVLPRVLEFFTTYSSQMGITNDWRIGEYISFTSNFILIFGFAFELPVLVMTIVFLGFLEYQTMARSRAYAVIAILVIAAVITPTPDILTLGLLAIPMYLLYELCIILAWIVHRKQLKSNEQENKKDHQRRLKLHHHTSTQVSPPLQVIAPKHLRPLSDEDDPD